LGSQTEKVQRLAPAETREVLQVVLASRGDIAGDAGGDQMPAQRGNGRPVRSAGHGCNLRRPHSEGDALVGSERSSSAPDDSGWTQDCCSGDEPFELRTAREVAEILHLARSDIVEGSPHTLELDAHQLSPGKTVDGQL
jgi:hypothetical protein